MAVPGLQLPANATKVQELVNPAKKMIVRDVFLQTKIIEKPLRCRLHPHHRPVLLANRHKDGITDTSLNQGRPNQQNLPLGDIGDPPNRTATRLIAMPVKDERVPRALRRTEAMRRSGRNC